ncbi:hypothetical protein ACM39_03580 [Chryseobacterium sp. FH2]|uniref:hypothetical protein n=1 Tax=Chryseobacterium sp. FH2 TaxID=1674291 RepID=UPI00065AD0E9|nr:hypothetical protein [Chryseobacterium sp. FH2]KMQ69196.1 hypothetical protein ACM39_03580 [Chryseobacterium sp. FH2]
MTPISYIFTELNKIQAQLPGEAFGPVGTGTASEKQFNLTNIFKTLPNEIPKAFAVTDGILFIVPQKDSADLVNIFLKPTNPVEIGIKIKYYVYRGIKKGNYFQAGGSSVDELLKKEDSNILPFLTKIWDEFLEFNQIPAANANTVPFEANKIGFSPAIPANYQAFFTKNQYTLPKVKIGDHIGDFEAEFGFEVVVDEGDFSQDHTDTGFDFKQDYFTARKCVLNLDKNNDAKDYGNLPNDPDFEKVFRESVYLFLDPVAYYGAHLTDISTDNKRGSIINNGTPTTPYKTPEEIYTNVVNKFYNKNKTYIYIKSNRGRSFKFYKNENERIYYQCTDVNQTPSSSWTPTSFLTNKWPLIIKSAIDEKYGISLGSSDKNIAYIHSLFFEEVKISNSDKRIPRKGNLISNLINFKLNILTFNNLNVSSFFNITFLNEDDLPFPNPNEFCNLFGNVNLKSIFEREDFSTGQGSFVNHLRPILIKDGRDIGMYQTKLILEGNYIADTNPPALPGNPADVDLALSKNLRTYILSPQYSTLQKKDDNPFSLTSGYYSAKDMEEYINNIYRGGEIWKGIITDGSNFSSLLYRRKDNDDNMPLYQLGMSQKEYLLLENDAKTIDINAANFFFNIEEDTGSTSPAFIKYRMKMQFDKKDGTVGNTANSIPLYTVDGYFFFTKDYSSAFKHGKEFANIAVDFVPYNLSSYLNGYECGFDYFWHDYYTSPSDGGRLYENLLGKYYKNATGNLENLDVKHLSDYTFKVNRKTFFNLIALKYNSKPTRWRFTNGDSALHADSYLTLYPKPHSLAKEVTVNLKFSKNKNPDQLYIKYNKKYIAINNSTATATANDEYGKFIIPSDKYKNPITSTNNNYSIKIMALRECNQDIPIEVIAVQGKDEKLAGKCWIRKNSERYNIKIVLVNCKTDLNGTVKEGLPPSNVTKVKEILQNFLRQILIDPKFDLTDVDLTVTDFKNNYAPTGKIESNENMFNFVKNLLTSDQQKQMVLLFFNESATNPTLGGQATIVNDYIGGALGARIFALGITDTTIAHEALHSIGLYHSFDNDGDYTFEYVKTNNIMDYSSPRTLIWYWQDLKVKKTSNNNKLIKDI